MTMPCLMNCVHSNSGWCLDCVGELVKEHEQDRDTLGELLASIDYFEQCADPGVGREVQGVSVRLYSDGSGDLTVGVAAPEKGSSTKAMLSRVFHSEVSYPFDGLDGLFGILKNMDSLRPVHPEAQ